MAESELATRLAGAVRVQNPGSEADAVGGRLRATPHVHAERVRFSEDMNILSSLRAFRRARGGEAKGRVDWKLVRWHVAKCGVAVAQSDIA